MAYEHPSGLPKTYDRADAGPNRQTVLQPEGNFIEGATINELQTIARRRTQRVGNMIAKDGDRVSGADVSVDTGAGTVSLTAGSVYARGDVRAVPAAVITGVSMTENVQIGIRIQKTLVTWDDDPTLRGLEPGTKAEGQSTAAREEENAVWALPGDTQAGDFFPVYLVVNGTVVDQSPPPALTGVLATISGYDFQANGHYIVDGCVVSALGKLVSDQVFSLSKGTANILGWKRTRETAFRISITEDPDLEAVAAEPSTYTAADNAPNVVTVLRPPISAVTAAIVVKRVSEVVVRGPVPGGTDALAHSSAIQIESVVQGTTFAAGTYVLSGGNISWAPAGAEPANASTYTVTYLYNASVTPDSVTDTTVTVSGGINGKTVLLSYTSKLPRKDIMCLNVAGLPVYVKGLSSRFGAVPPPTPGDLLKVAEITNDWLAAPLVDNDGTHNVTYDLMARYFKRLIDVLDQFDRSELSRDITSREPVSKNGIFTDNFTDDFYRDQGLAQTAATNNGVLQLAVDQVLLQRIGGSIATLPFTEEVIVSQKLATSGMLINPYANFIQMPAGLKLEPATDFWTDHLTLWTSPVTQEFTAAPGQPPGSTTVNVEVSDTQVAATFMRQIALTFTIEGFGVGENLQTLTFAGVNVKPAGTQTANGSGVITNTFTIPAKVPVGTATLRAEGAAGSFAEAIYYATGTVDVTTMQRVTLVTRAAPPPVTVINVTQTVVQQVTQTIVRSPVTVSNQNDWDSRHGGPDPLAQTFTLEESRMVVGFDIKFTAIGDRTKGVRVQLASTLNGYPNNDILAEAFINMQTPVVGALVHARFDTPVYLSPLREYCFVVMTDDNAHALAVAKLGDVDTDPITGKQTFVSSQPYTVGVLLSSSNRATWTPHNDADLFFNIVAAKFTGTTRTVNLWTGALNTVSDLFARGAIDIPTADTACRYEIVRASGDVISLAADQITEFTDYVSETVTLRAVLTGSAKFSPTLYPGTTLIGGRIRTTGTYATAVFPMGTAVTVKARFAAKLPAGSSVTVDVDAVNNTWTSVPADTTGTLGGGWIEPSFKKTSYTAASGGRVRITLNGGPAARPFLARMRSYSL